MMRRSTTGLINMDSVEMDIKKDLKKMTNVRFQDDEKEESKRIYTGLDRKASVHSVKDNGSLSSLQSDAGFLQFWDNPDQHTNNGQQHFLGVNRENTSLRMSKKLPGYASSPARNAIAKYVKENIKHRECSKYIRDLKKNDGSLCQCGRDEYWHTSRTGVDLAIDHHQEKWSSAKHTRVIEAHTFGTLQFHGFGQESVRHAPYVRVDHETPPEDVWNLLSDFWHMPAPKLIVSVTGGAKRFFMKNRLKTSFKRGLINAATSTGAWIITGGTNLGVMEFVGEAVRDHMLTTGTSEQQVIALGIATWGIVDNKENLISDDGMGMFPASYKIDELSPKGAYGIAPLDQNHTHFILVDNGTEKKFGGEIKFRATLEHYISEMMETGVARNQSVHVPVVLLVLEGGENTLQTAAEATQKNTPVVVIQGSGRAADFIAIAYKQTKSKEGNEDKSSYPPNFDEDISKQACRLFDLSRVKDEKARAQKVQTCLVNVKALLDRRQLLTVFSMDDVDTTNEIDQAILYSLLKANRSDAQSQLNLALAWNRCDVARTEIFNIENRSQWQHMNMYEAMLTALVQDRVDFVQLFLDNGVDLRRFLTIRRMRDLYDDVVNDRYAGNSADLLRHLLQQVQQQAESQTWKSMILCCKREKWQDDLPNLLSIVGLVINYLMGDQQKNPYSDPKYIVKDESYNQPINPETPRTEMNHTLSLRKKYKADFPNPEHELFLWAVLLNRRELALVFWKISRDHIGAALAASSLLKSLANEADNEEEIDLSNDLMKHSQEWEEVAVGVLNECYQRDKTLAHRLLVREIDTWGGATLFILADSAEQMEFMGHSCCQTKLNRIWKGKMALYTSTWKILAALFMPLVLPLIKFSTNEITVEKSEDQSFAISPELAEDLHNKPTPNQVAPEQSSSGTGDQDDSEFVRATARRRRGRLTRKLYKVAFFNMCCDKDADSISILQAAYYYHIAPVTKFYYHTISYLIFLAIFSFFVLTDLHPTDEDQASIYEYIIWGWASTLLVEEVRQNQGSRLKKIVTRDPKSISYKVSGYFNSLWNRFDMTVHLLFILSIILRFSLSGADFVWARMFYTITLVFYFLRFMHVFFEQKNIGPKVIMIRRMLTDLLFFISILLVVMVAYGVASQALRFPNSPISWNLLKDIFYLPYWQMYGELFLEDLEGEVPNCSYNRTIYENNSSIPRCPEKSWLAIVLFAIYMIMTNILLLNLLIAMFSYTFERVQENSEKVWRFYRYSLIFEYFDRPTLAPPFIILSHIWRVMKFFYYYVRKFDKINSDFRNVLSEDENKKMTAFERAGMENYLLKQHKLTREHIDAKVSSAGERIEKVIEDLDQLKDQMSTYRVEDSDTSLLTKPRSPPASRSDDKQEITSLHRRVVGLEGQLEAQGEQLGEVMSMLRSILQAQQGTSTKPLPEPHIEIQEVSES